MSSRCFNASLSHSTWRHSSCSRARNHIIGRPFSPKLRYASDQRGLPASQYHYEANSRTFRERLAGPTQYGVHANTHSRQILGRVQRGDPSQGRSPGIVHSRFGSVARSPSVAPLLIARDLTRVTAGLEISRAGRAAACTTQERGFRLSATRFNAKGRASVNEGIAAPTLLVVWERQEGVGKDSVVMSRQKALKLAKDNKLDLVLLNANVAPPVCQIMDYGAEQYRKKKKEKARAKISRKRQTKGVQMKGMIAPHDFERKVDDLVTYLERGDVVKVTLEANMRILRRNLNCLDELEAKLIKKLDPTLVNLVHSQSGNKLAKRDIVCTYKSVTSSAKQKKANQQANTPGSIAPPEPDTAFQSKVTPVTESFDEPNVGSGDEDSDYESDGEADDSDEEFGKDPKNMESGSELSAESSDEFGSPSSGDEKYVNNNSNETDDQIHNAAGVVAKAQPEESTDAAELKRGESVAQKKRREAREIALANVASVCARIKAGEEVIDDDQELVFERAREQGGDKVERERARKLESDFLDAEIEEDLLHMRQTGAFDGMDDDAVQEYHDNRRKKKRRPKTEIDAFFEGERGMYDETASKGKGRSKGKKKGVDDEDDPDWSVDGDDEMGGGRRRKKWEVAEGKGLIARNGPGKGQHDYSGDGGRGRGRVSAPGGGRGGPGRRGGGRFIFGDRARVGMNNSGGRGGEHQGQEKNKVDVNSSGAGFGMRKRGATARSDAVNGDRSSNVDVNGLVSSRPFDERDGDEGSDGLSNAKGMGNSHSDSNDTEEDDGQHGYRLEGETAEGVSSDVTREFAKSFLGGVSLDSHLSKSSKSSEGRLSDYRSGSSSDGIGTGHQKWSDGIGFGDNAPQQDMPMCESSSNAVQSSGHGIRGGSQLLPSVPGLGRDSDSTAAATQRFAGLFDAGRDPDSSVRTEESTSPSFAGRFGARADANSSIPARNRTSSFAGPFDASGSTDSSYGDPSGAMGSHGMNKASEKAGEAAATPDDAPRPTSGRFTALFGAIGGKDVRGNSREKREVREPTKRFVTRVEPGERRVDDADTPARN